MTTTQNRRPPGEGAAEHDRLATCSDSTEEAFDRRDATRPRCGRCGHPTSDPRSIATGYGPVCRRRVALAQLDGRRDSIGRSLRALAARVARLDVSGLALVSTGLGDVLDALDALEVTR